MKPAATLARAGTAARQAASGWLARKRPAGGQLKSRLRSTRPRRFDVLPLPCRAVREACRQT
ncbi:uncharacterized protein AruCF_4262 [Achromobacter ruhlandii]|nr:uncharacterized protein AruCF_4262 [Achromobacter ruhlandii]